MRFWEYLRNRDLLTEVFRTIQAVARTAKTAIEAREALAMRLSVKARAGDFDDAIKRLSDSDALVQDFLKNG